MPVVEKNDVDIERLFTWSKECVITGLQGKDMTVYVRLLGDADLNRARVMSLRITAEFRKTLKDEDSDERIAFIPYKEELTKEMLVESILILTLRETTQQIMRETTLKLPKEPPSDATTEDLEKFQKEVDEFPEKREKVLKEKIEKITERKRSELSEKDEDSLYKSYVEILIRELCDQELLKRFKEHCVFFGTYQDKKFTKRLFNSFDVFDNLPKEVKDKLIETYEFLEIESDELKK